MKKGKQVPSSKLVRFGVLASSPLALGLIVMTLSVLKSELDGVLGSFGPSLYESQLLKIKAASK